MKRYMFLIVLFLEALSPNILNAQERVFEDTIAGFRIDRRKTTDNCGQIKISVLETESGLVKRSYPP